MAPFSPRTPRFSWHRSVRSKLAVRSSKPLMGSGSGCLKAQRARCECADISEQAKSMCPSTLLLSSRGTSRISTARWFSGMVQTFPACVKSSLQSNACYLLSLSREAVRRRLTCCAEERHSDSGWIRYYLQTGMFVNLLPGPKFSQTIVRKEWNTHWYCQEPNSIILPDFHETV